MPRRRDERNRVLGPTWIPSSGYWRIVVITPQATDPKKRRTTQYHREEADAIEVVEKIHGQLSRFAGTTMKQAIEGYEKHLIEKGTIGYAETVRRLRAFFPDQSVLVGRVSAERAKVYYENFRQRKRPDGEPISVDYHRAALINARSLFKWGIGQGWISANPFAGVEGVGRRNAGKQQLTGSEVRKLYVHCLSRAQGGDRAALGVLVAFLMALRSGDITRRLVRDVDLDGTVLRVWDGKTKKSNRPRKIPLVLQPLLVELAGDRSPFDPLFKTPYTKDGHHTRRWLEQAMERFCKAVGIVYVCPHSLKGANGTLAAEMGDTADRIAEHLSHEETGTTRRHYVSAGAIEDAQTERALKVLVGGKK